jgi:hypothetical protein
MAKTLKRAIADQMPGWKVSEPDPKPHAARRPDVVSPSTAAMQKKYSNPRPLSNKAQRDASLDTADDSTEAVVLERNGKKIRVDYSKATKRIVTSQG